MRNNPISGNSSITMTKGQGSAIDTWFAEFNESYPVNSSIIFLLTNDGGNAETIFVKHIIANKTCCYVYFVNVIL